MGVVYCPLWIAYEWFKGDKGKILLSLWILTFGSSKWVLISQFFCVMFLISLTGLLWLIAYVSMSLILVVMVISFILYQLHPISSGVPIVMSLGMQNVLSE